MLPHVETENSRPAVRPSTARSGARSRTAIGVTAASSTLGGPKSRIIATTGSARGPGSQSTTNESTRPWTTGTSSTATAPSEDRAEQERRRGQPVGGGPAGGVPEREPGEDDADHGAPDVERVAEERREHAARRDLDPEQHPSGDEDGRADRAPSHAGKRSRGSAAATVAGWPRART